MSISDASPYNLTNSDVAGMLGSRFVDLADPMLAAVYLNTLPHVTRNAGIWNLVNVNAAATAIPDLSGHGRPLAPFGLVPQFQDPAVPTAANYVGVSGWSNFNGSSRYAVNTTPANFNGVSFVSAWYYINTGATGLGMIASNDSNGAVATRHFQLRYDITNNRIDLIVFDGAISYTFSGSAGVGMSVETWHHVAAFWNYPAAGGLRLIIDGETFTASNVTTYNTAGTLTQFVVGARYTGAIYDSYFNGRIAHVWAATGGSVAAYFARQFYEKTRAAFGV